MIKAVRWVVLVGLSWATVTSLPGVARYLKMRSM
jgi:uncharacterized protein DUF6893